MPSVLQIYAPQKLWRTQIVDRIAAVSNYWTVTNYGVVGDGVTDDTAAWQAIFDAVPNGTIIIVPDPTFVMVLTATITMTDKRDVWVTSQLDARNFAPAPTFRWEGSNNGVMLDMERCQSCHVVGFNWNTVNGTTVDTAVNIDGYSGGNISTKNTIQYNAFDFSNQLNSSAKIINISDTVSNNNENMQILDNEIIVSNTGYPTPSSSAGYGIVNGYTSHSANAKHHVIHRNGISNATIGIYSLNGSVDVDHLGGGANKVDIQIDNSTEPTTIRHLETENSTQGVDFAPQSNVLILEACRFSNSGQTNTGGFVKVDGIVLMIGNNFEVVPPVGGTCIECVQSGNLRLSLYENNFQTPVTYAQSGLSAYATFLRGTTSTGNLVAFNNAGITGAPSRYNFALSGFDPITGDPTGFFFGNPIAMQGYTFNTLTATGSFFPASPAMAIITNSSTTTWGAAIADAGGGGSKVLATCLDGATWRVAGV